MKKTTTVTKDVIGKADVVGNIAFLYTYLGINILSLPFDVYDIHLVEEKNDFAVFVNFQIIIVVVIVRGKFTP